MADVKRVIDKLISISESASSEASCCGFRAGFSLPTATVGASGTPDPRDWTGAKELAMNAR